jgi:hypothetical protein
MAKSNKISYENAKVEIVEGQVKLTLIDEESGEIIQEGNLLADVETVLKASAEPKLDITIKEFKPKKESNRKPTYKYTCGCEGNIIKSGSEDLNIHCNECDKDFEIVEE